MNVSEMIVGAVFLFAGRKLFWLFVGIMGFLVGMNFAASLVPPSNALTMMILSVVLGILGAILAVGFQWVAVILAGFLGGGYFLMNIFTFWTGQTEPLWWLFIVGGILGILVLVIAFDWALIGISSLVGAMLIVEQLKMNEPAQSVLLLVFLGLGIAVQCLTLGPSLSGEGITRTSN